MKRTLIIFCSVILMIIAVLPGCNRLTKPKVLQYSNSYDSLNDFGIIDKDEDQYFDFLSKQFEHKCEIYTINDLEDMIVKIVSKEQSDLYIELFKANNEKKANEIFSISQLNNIYQGQQFFITLKISNIVINAINKDSCDVLKKIIDIEIPKSNFSKLDTIEILDEKVFDSINDFFTKINRNNGYIELIDCNVYTSLIRKQTDNGYDILVLFKGNDKKMVQKDNIKYSNIIEYDDVIFVTNNYEFYEEFISIVKGDNG